MEEEYVFACIHKDGDNIRYIKTNNEGMSHIINDIYDKGYTIQALDPQAWEDNINTGVSIEVIEYHQIENALRKVII